jgi:hypothetical protein
MIMPPFLLQIVLSFKQGTAMTPWRKLFPYILLNVVVSAVTTLGVLLAWDAIRSKNNAEISPATDATAVQSISKPATPIPADAVVIEVEAVMGVGDLKNETVRLVRKGSGDLDLEGWTLQDGNGHKYAFPKLDFINGSIEVHTGSGSDTAVSLHWGLSGAVWQSGEKVKVLDPQNILRASYTIP